MFNKIYDKAKEIIKDNYKILILYIIVILLFFIKLPYVIYAPGGAIELNDRIKVDNKNTTNGEISMAYVSQINGNIPFILLSFIIPNWDIIKVEDITYENQSLEELYEINRLELNGATDDAIISAFKEANKEIHTNNYELNVIYIDDLANTDLQLFDKITKINGIEVQELDDIKNIIEKLDENIKVSIEIERDNKKRKATAITYKGEDNKTKIGISAYTDYDVETNPEVEIETKTKESGPSGGFMMALSIYDNLVKEDIIKGRNIIGTGTIDSEGNVGEIGGVKYKILGAVKNNAQIFFCPKENYEEALKTAKDNNLNIQIVPVSTLKEAIDYLKK